MEWRTIEGFPKYQVSDSGQVMNKTTGKVLKPIINSEGYRTFGLGHGYMRRGARLVAEAFLPRPSDDPLLEVAHNDGSRDNDDVSNLRWATKSENQRDRVRHGTHMRGVRASSAKFQDYEVKAIRYQMFYGCSTNLELAHRHNVSYQTIIAMARRETYQDIV